MNRLSLEDRSQIIRCLVDGTSINATCRIAGVAKNTVLKLLADVGEACVHFQRWELMKLPCRRLQCDEIWSFCYAKQKNVPADLRGQFGFGDVWVWTALCADTKLMPCWRLGPRDAHTAYWFMRDLASRLTNRVQLTTDGHAAYLSAVDGAFHGDIDYAMLVKLYGGEPAGEARYSSPKCIGCRAQSITGDPDPADISTSYVERQNLTMRMGMRRFTRLTNAFSKKVANHAHAISLHYMFYNYERVHKSLPKDTPTPAMAAGKADHVWTVEEIVRLAEPKSN